MNRSLKSRLLTAIVMTTVVGFALASVLIYTQTRRGLYHEFDALLAGKGRALATLIKQEGDSVDIEFADHPMQEFARKIAPEYYQVWDEAGLVLARSRRLGNQNLPRGAGSLAAPSFINVELPDGRAGRLVSMDFLASFEGEELETSPDDDDDEEVLEMATEQVRREITIVVARDTTSIDQALARQGWTLLIVGVACTSGMLVILFWLVNRSLEPLNQLAYKIAQLDERTLTQVGISDCPAELAPVVNRLNELVERLEQAFQREREFTADVAHELRTPLAGLRSTLEVVLSRRRETATYRQALVECANIGSEMQGLVETLLSLARIDAGQANVQYSPIRFYELVEQEWNSYVATARQRDLHVHLSGEADVVLRTDATKLRIVLSNLLANAIAYSDEGGQIKGLWSVVDGRFRFHLVNSGCKLSAEQTEKVFDRFWRGDSSRAATGVHAGLGLALCRKIVDLLDGTILAFVAGGSFHVQIEFEATSVVHVEHHDLELWASNGQPARPDVPTALTTASGR